MSRLWTMLTLFMFIGNPAFADDLIRLSLDDASTIGTTIQSDSHVKIEGKGSIRITTRHPTTICLGVVNDLNVENARLVYKAKVKSDLKGTAFLEMWAHVGKGRYFSKGMDHPIEGKSDWQSLHTPFIFRKGQNPTKITLNIVINGQGTVWIDDIVLSKTSL